MPWMAVDDQMYGNRKFRKLKGARWAVTGFWVTCGSWCASALTDGFIPDYVMEDWDPEHTMATQLLEVGLWTRAQRDGDDGYQFHDWLAINPSAAEITEKRRRNAERQAAWRARKKADDGPGEPPPDGDGERDATDDGRVTDLASHASRNGGRNVLRHAGGNRVTDTVTNDGPLPSPPLPLTTEKTSSSPSSRKRAETAPRRADVEALCERLRDKILENGFKPAPRITDTWRRDARLLLDADGRDHAQALRLIDWAQQDSFWAPNIRSMGKFRQQWDKLISRAREEHARKTGLARIDQRPQNPTANGGLGEGTTADRMAAILALKGTS